MMKAPYTKRTREKAQPQVEFSKPFETTIDTFGAFVCAECAAVHRAPGSHCAMGKQLEVLDVIADFFLRRERGHEEIRT